MELPGQAPSGTVVAAKTDTRAATADIDIDGDGDGRRHGAARAGDPRHHAARRAAFIDFTDYRDQIEFAELARALNDQAYKTALAAVPQRRAGGQDR